MLDNQEILDHVEELREAVRPPEKRRYSIVARDDHLRINYDEGVSLAPMSDLAPALRRLGYRLDGGNFESNILVFRHESYFGDDGRLDTDD